MKINDKAEFITLIRSLGMEYRFNRFLNAPENKDFSYLCHYFFNRKRLIGVFFWIHRKGSNWTVRAETFEASNSGILWQQLKHKFHSEVDHLGDFTYTVK
jgi:hypothetical protein